MINKRRYLKTACLVSVAVLLGACSSQEIAAPESDDMQASTSLETTTTVTAPQVTNWERPQPVTWEKPQIAILPTPVPAPIVVAEVPVVTVATPAASGNTGGASNYLVKKGDTVYEVMRQTGVYWKDIIRMNNLKAPSYTIQPGQTLRIK